MRVLARTDEARTDEAVWLSAAPTGGSIPTASTSLRSFGASAGRPPEKGEVDRATRSLKKGPAQLVVHFGNSGIRMHAALGPCCPLLFDSVDRNCVVRGFWPFGPPGVAFGLLAGCVAKGTGRLLPGLEAVLSHPGMRRQIEV